MFSRAKSTIVASVKTSLLVDLCSRHTLLIGVGKTSILKQVARFHVQKVPIASVTISLLVDFCAHSCLIA